MPLTLEPGGYLQYTDMDPHRYEQHFSQDDDNAPGELMRMIHDAFAIVQYKTADCLDPGNMKSGFERAGFQDVATYCPQPSRAIWQPMTQCVLIGCGELCGTILAQEKVSVEAAGRFRRQIDKAWNEFREKGGWIDMRSTRCVGRKPER